MQSRSENSKKISTITFTLFNLVLHQLNDSTVSANIEKLSPSLADHLCAIWGVEVKQLSAKLIRNPSRTVFGCKFELTVLLDETKQQLDAAALQEEINAALQKAIATIDPALSTLKFPPINPEHFSVSYSDESTDKMCFKGKVGKWEYSYTSLNETDSLTVHFINEAEQTTHHLSNQRNMAYDRWHNIIAMTYSYPTYEPKEEDLQRLEEEAEALIKSRFAGKAKPFLQSIKDRQFGQALRRACSVKSVELFQLLAKFYNEKVIVLNLNEFTLSTRKTALDYAIEADNQELVAILKSNHAQTFAECATRLVEHDREVIYSQNPSRKVHSVGQSAIFGNQTFPHEHKQEPRHPKQLIHETLVEQCLRTGDSFHHYVHDGMTPEERANLDAYERKCREKYKKKQESNRTRNAFGMHHAHQSFFSFGDHEQQPRRPQDLISEPLVEQCLRNGDSFTHFVHTSMTPQEKANLEAYERKRREEYKQQEARNGRNTFGIHLHNHGRDPFGGNDNNDPFNTGMRWH